MAVPLRDHEWISSDDYLAGERASEVRHEWVDGVVYSMAGASKTHGRVITNLTFALTPAARAKGCLVVSNDLMVATEHAYYYPDIVVSCDSSDDQFVEQRPCLLVDVLSPSTRRIDRHEKLAAYQFIPALVDYWIIDHENAIVDVWHRSGDQWTGSQRRSGDSVDATCLGITLTIDDILSGV
jgi:Uma2 family endonuclease